MAPRPTVALTLLATTGLLAACGSADHPAGKDSARTAPATGARSRITKPPTKAQAIAFARAVNLTAADVPGLRATSKHEHEPKTAAERRLEQDLQRCVGGSGNSSEGLAQVNSKEFKLEREVLYLSVNSKVSVARTSAIAAEELAAIHSGHVRGCLSRYLNLLLKSEFLKGHDSSGAVNPNSISVKIAQGTPPAPGATGSFAWLITATFVVRNVRIPFYLDILGFVYGPAQVSLFSSAALKHFPAPVQEHLYRLLLERAKAHGI